MDEIIETYFPVIFFGAFILTIIFIIKYVSVLKEISRLIESRESEMFGRHYHGFVSLYSDMHFLNKLYDGKAIQEIEDIDIRTQVGKAHRLLRWQIRLGIFIFVLFLLNAYISV